MLNKVILIGRITHTPELKSTQSGVSVLSFSLAVERNRKDADGKYPTDFINCVAWRSTAEFIAKHFGKGEKISVIGSLQMRKYTDKDGNNRTTFDVVTDEVGFVESKRERDSDDSDAPEIATPVNIDTDDDDLPF